MLTWIVIIGVLAAAIIWVLWTPMRLDINTRSGIYQVSWGGMVLNWLPEEALDVIKIRVFFWRWKLSLVGKRKQSGDTNNPKSTTKGTYKKQKVRISLKMIRRIAGSFQVKYCHLSLDTGDYLWNAWLFPAFWFLRRPNCSVWINFTGENELLVRVENRLGRLLWVFISSYII